MAQRTRTILILFILCVCASLSVALPIWYSQPSVLYSREISPTCFLRIWSLGKDDSTCNFKVTYHRGIAIGLFVIDYFSIPTPTTRIDLQYASDDENGVQYVFDQELGIVFVYRRDRDEHWTAGRRSGSRATEMNDWQAIIKRSHEQNPNIPVSMLHVSQ